MEMSQSAKVVLFNKHIMCLHVFPKLLRRGCFHSLQKMEGDVELEMVDSERVRAWEYRFKTWL